MAYLSEIPSFTGTYSQAIDDKARFSIPSDYRRIINQRNLSLADSLLGLDNIIEREEVVYLRAGSQEMPIFRIGQDASSLSGRVYAVYSEQRGDIRMYSAVDYYISMAKGVLSASDFENTYALDIDPQGRVLIPKDLAKMLSVSPRKKHSVKVRGQGSYFGFLAQDIQES